MVNLMLVGGKRICSYMVSPPIFPIPHSPYPDGCRGGEGRQASGRSPHFKNPVYWTRPPYWDRSPHLVFTIAIPLLPISIWTCWGEPRPVRCGKKTQKVAVRTTYFVPPLMQNGSRQRQWVVHREPHSRLVPRLRELTTPLAGGRPAKKCCEV